MKDMVGVLLLYVFPSIQCSSLTSHSLNNMKNDDGVTAFDGMKIDRLKSLVELTADDIKVCSNVCDAYMKKRPLAKVMLSSVWDEKLFDFAKLFTRRRQEFQFELTIRTSQGVDKANAKLDVIEDTTRELSEQFRLSILLSQLRTDHRPQDERNESAVPAAGQPRAKTAFGACGREGRCEGPPGK